MGDCEGQSVLKKEEPFMVTITVPCPHCQSEALVRNEHAPNGKQLSRCRACGRQSRENPTPHAYPPACREEILYASQERSSLRGLTRTDRGFRVPPCPRGSKKRSSASPFVCNAARPGSRGSHVHDSGTGRAPVVCAQKSTQLLDLDCPLSKEPASRRLRSGIGANRRVSDCGKPLQRGIGRGTAKRLSGRPTRR